MSDATAGILPRQEIRHLIEAGIIASDVPVTARQVQPASLDLRLGNVAHRIRASFLTGPNATVADKLGKLTLHSIDISRGAVLETGCVYLVPIEERLALPAGISATANPKSSTGRLDVFTRVITDSGRAFDTVPAGYHGPLYAEISPRTFPVLVRAGSTLSQIRFRRGEAGLDDRELLALHDREGIVFPGRPVVAGGLHLTVDLLGGHEPGGPIGYRAKRHTGVIDIDLKGGCDLYDFWEPVITRGEASLILDPDEFYILASCEAVHVPPEVAAEMVPIDPLVGEFRVHYAGFFDPGFGHAAAGGSGSRAVLEVRSHEVPFIIDHGQVVGRLVYERMSARPDVLYGQDLGSNYQAQGLKLSKHFRA